MKNGRHCQLCGRSVVPERADAKVKGVSHPRVIGLLFYKFSNNLQTLQTSTWSVHVKNTRLHNSRPRLAHWTSLLHSIPQRNAGKTKMHEIFWHPVEWHPFQAVTPKNWQEVADLTTISATIRNIFCSDSLHLVKIIFSPIRNHQCLVLIFLIQTIFISYNPSEVPEISYIWP